MAEDITATPPDAAETFLDQDWHQTTTSTVHVFQEAAGPYKKIDLYDFKFLGRKFQPQTYHGTRNGASVPGTSHTGAGVCAEFRDVLFAAQKLIFRSYAAQARSTGEEPTPAGFTKWCGVQVVSGWQFRSRQHSKGAAIDLDAKFNPYVPTGSLDNLTSPGALGGEQHAGVADAAIGSVRAACLAAYANAFKLVHGSDMPRAAMGHGPNADTGSAYEDISRTHFAMVVYSQLAFQQTVNNRLDQQFGFARPFGPASEPGSFLFTLKQFAPLLKGQPDSDLQEQFNIIRDDYEKLRLGMVYGKLKSSTPGHLNMGVTWAESTRDPCFGFLSIRKEIAVGLRVAGCRWGAIDFGTASNGDMMHFDKKWTIDQIKHTDDENAAGILYVQG